MAANKTPYLWKYKGKGSVWINSELEDLVTAVARHNALDPFDHTVRAFYKREIVGQMCQEDPGLCTHTGLGDLVHMFTLPVALLIDSVFGTRLKDCKSCKRRRALLNRIRI